jgi:SHS2 domain-containing protein
MEPPAASARFEEHVGELKLALRAPTLEDLFVEAARVVARECGAPEGTPGPWEAVRLSARDAPTLLVDWLNELIGRSEVENRAYGDVRGFGLETGDGSGAAAAGVGPMEADHPLTLTAEIRGTPVPVWESALKAATYHGLELARDGGGWRAAVLFDV